MEGMKKTTKNISAATLASSQSSNSSGNTFVGSGSNSANSIEGQATRGILNLNLVAVTFSRWWKRHWRLVGDLGALFGIVLILVIFVVLLVEEILDELGEHSVVTNKVVVVTTLGYGASLRHDDDDIAGLKPCDSVRDQDSRLIG